MEREAVVSKPVTKRCSRCGSAATHVPSALDPFVDCPDCGIVPAIRKPREPRRGRHIKDLPKPQAAGVTLAHIAYGLVQYDRTHWDKPNWQHYLTVARRHYRNVRTGRHWDEGR